MTVIVHCGHYYEVLSDEQFNNKTVVFKLFFTSTILDKNWFKNSGRNLFMPGRFKPVLAETWQPVSSFGESIE